jgi:pimeloyl-ACP methyl ester carboxylesterase
MIKRSVESARGKVFYWVSENRKDRTIIFTHGVTGDHTLFHRQIEFFEQDYTVLTWDMPYHGESIIYQNFTHSNAADDMKQIMEQEGISHTVMVGQSAGGFVVQAFILKYPNMVDAFISIDSTPFGMKYYKKSELFWTIHYSDIAKLIPYGYYCKSAAKAVAMTEEARKSFYDCLVKLGKKGMLNAADAVYKDFSNYDEVPFTCPVLLLLGQYDKTGYVKKYNEMWAKETGYPLVIIPEAAHNSNYDNYQYFNQKVYEFLDRVYH